MESVGNGVKFEKRIIESEVPFVNPFKERVSRGRQLQSLNFDRIDTIDRIL